MPHSRLRQWHQRAALVLTAALVLAACSGDAPDTQEADPSGASATTPSGEAATEGDGAAEDTETDQGDSAQPSLESGPPPVSAGAEQPEGTELVEQDGFSVSIPEEWDEQSAQTERHYTDPSAQNRGFAVSTYDASAGSVEEALRLAAADLEGAGLEARFYRLDWPGADDAALVTYDDPEAAPPAVLRTYQLFAETSAGSFWVVAYDEAERFEDSPVTEILASFRPQE